MYKLHNTAPPEYEWSGDRPYGDTRNARTFLSFEILKWHTRCVFNKSRLNIYDRNEKLKRKRMIKAAPAPQLSMHMLASIRHTSKTWKEKVQALSFQITCNKYGMKWAASNDNNRANNCKQIPNKRNLLRHKYNATCTVCTRSHIS